MANLPKRPSKGPPRWVKGFGVAALMLAAIFFFVHLTGGMSHMHSNPAGGVTQNNAADGQ